MFQDEETSYTAGEVESVMPWMDELRVGFRRGEKHKKGLTVNEDDAKVQNCRYGAR